MEEQKYKYQILSKVNLKSRKEMMVFFFNPTKRYGVRFWTLALPINSLNNIKKTIKKRGMILPIFGKLDPINTDTARK